MDTQKVLHELARKDPSVQTLSHILLEYIAQETDMRINTMLLHQLLEQYNSLTHSLEEKIELIRKISITDPLTKIYNRIKFDESLNEQIDLSKRYRGTFSLIMFDIDHFKKINDTHGHAAGDDILSLIAKNVGQMIRTTDIFARWGGEEFMILTPSTVLKESTMLAEKVRKAIASFKFPHVEQVTISGGVSQYQENETRESLIKRIDEALYNAKEQGRNKIISA